MVSAAMPLLVFLTKLGNTFSKSVLEVNEHHKAKQNRNPITLLLFEFWFLNSFCLRPGLEIDCFKSRGHSNRAGEDKVKCQEFSCKQRLRGVVVYLGVFLP